MASRIEVLGVRGLPEIRPGDDIARMLLDACARESLALIDGDILVVTQKIVSKSEGRLVALAEVEPSALARRYAESFAKDPREVDVVLREARRIVRMDHGVLITETAHGFVCANSGVDASNLESREQVALLPIDPDRSAAELRRRLEEATGTRVAVVISDTFGRPWREGATNVAIGISGLAPMADHRGRFDSAGRALVTTVLAVADELAAAAELVMGKLDRVPVAIIRGYAFTPAEAGIQELLRKRENDLFR